MTKKVAVEYTTMGDNDPHANYYRVVTVSEVEVKVVEQRIAVYFMRNGFWVQRDVHTDGKRAEEILDYLNYERAKNKVNKWTAMG